MKNIVKMRKDVGMAMPKKNKLRMKALIHKKSVH